MILLNPNYVDHSNIIIIWIKKNYTYNYYLNNKKILHDENSADIINRNKNDMDKIVKIYI